jgi:hypothetical protein
VATEGLQLLRQVEVVGGRELRSERSLRSPLGQAIIEVLAYNSYVMSQRVPSAQLILYPDAGHGFLFQFPQLFGKHVLEFLAAQEGRMPMSPRPLRYSFLANGTIVAATRSARSQVVFRNSERKWLRCAFAAPLLLAQSRRSQGRVPALILDNGEPLAENSAILPYLGKRFGLWPTDTIAEAWVLSLIDFLATNVHPSVAHMWRPEALDERHPVSLQLRQASSSAIQV